MSRTRRTHRLAVRAIRRKKPAKAKPSRIATNPIQPQAKPDQIEPAPTFHPFPRLPTEIQLQIWKSVFQLRSLEGHVPALICTYESLRIALKQRHGRNLFAFRNSRQALYRNITSVGGSGRGETRVCTTTCVLGCCRTSPGDPLETGQMMRLGVWTYSSYRLVLPKESVVGVLLQTSRLSRLATLEAWREAVRVTVVVEEEKRRLKRERAGKVEVNGGNKVHTKSEMVRDVLRWILQKEAGSYVI